MNVEDVERNPSQPQVMLEGSMAKIISGKKLRGGDNGGDMNSSNAVRVQACRQLCRQVRSCAEKKSCPHDKQTHDNSRHR